MTPDEMRDLANRLGGAFYWALHENPTQDFHVVGEAVEALRAIAHDLDRQGESPEERVVIEIAVRRENPPHGPVSERVMQKAYGAKR